MNLLSRESLPVTSLASQSRLIAVACALQLAGQHVVAYADAAELASRWQRLEGWLDDASSDEDAQVRRVLLMLACDKAPPGTHPDPVLRLAKALHASVMAAKGH